MTDKSREHHTTEGKQLDQVGNLLRPGAFYWILPTLDVDTATAWHNELQPARFERYDEWRDVWTMLGIEDEQVDGAIWVGSEIAND